MPNIEIKNSVNKEISNTVAGVCIILQSSKILLVHPVNGSWQRPICGIPKGKMEAGETEMEAAVRELYEETGLLVNKDNLDREEYSTIIYNQKNIPIKRMAYFVYHIDSLSEIHLENEVLPKPMLQKEEIDWAGFLSKQEAYAKILPSQRIIIDRHL